MKFDYKIIEKQKNKLSVSIKLFESMDCFDGHFTNLSIMPAVAQLYIVEKLSHQNFNQTLEINGLRQVKFVGPICPDIEVTLILEMFEAKHLIAFEFLEGQTLKSKGKINFKSGQ